MRFPVSDQEPALLKEIADGKERRSIPEALGAQKTHFRAEVGLRRAAVFAGLRSSTSLSMANGAEAKTLPVTHRYRCRRMNTRGQRRFSGGPEAEQLFRIGGVHGKMGWKGGDSSGTANVLPCTIPQGT